ncbi:hypothetical protein GCM10028773_11490 [Spirosoma koreense]
MRQESQILLMIAGGLLCFTLYCLALLDWAQDFKTGLYGRNQPEAVVETASLLIYTFFAIRFVREKVKFF